MSIIIIPLIIIAVIISFFYIGQFPTGDWEFLRQGIFPQIQEPSSKKQTYYKKPTEPTTPDEPTEPTEPKKSSILIDTFITAGPKKGELIKETNKVTFEFEGKITAEQSDQQISFETKVIGLDDNWKKTCSQKRTIILPSGPQEYTFLVRAKIEDSVDPTPAGRTFNINVSPYFEKVKIFNVKVKTSSKPSLITITAQIKKQEEINFTDWEIKGKRGKFTIPQGIKYYHSLFGNTPRDNIVVKPGDVIYISSGINPFGKGKNFKPNKCFGYLSKFYYFPISVPTGRCPGPKKEELSSLSACCEEFILDLKTCEIPSYSQNLKIATDSECTTYLNENFNYNGCFRNFSKDKNFLKNNWHIYPGKNIVASEERDILYLRDQNGLFVDKHSYGCRVCK